MSVSIALVRARFAFTAAAVMLVAACGNKGAMQDDSVPAPLRSKMRAEFQAGAERLSDNTLAYEHYLEIEIAAELLAARIEAVRVACVENKDAGCTLLDIANHELDGIPQGNIKVRLAPSGVSTLIRLAGDGGNVSSNRTSAEDLAQPIADTDRQLALLELHRKRLMELMSRKDIGVTDLITVSRELATVQTQLDDFGSTRANLRRRVDTELLTISWRPPVTAFLSTQSPVVDSLKSFGANFREAIAQVITFFAYVLPWLALAIPGLMLIRWGWKSVRRRWSQNSVA